MRTDSKFNAVIYRQIGFMNWFVFDVLHCWDRGRFQKNTFLDSFSCIL